MCKILFYYILTITTEINSGHVVYSETFTDKQQCEEKASDYKRHAYVLDARCYEKAVMEGLQDE